MASMKSISRLHAEVKSSNFEHLEIGVSTPEPEQVKLDNLSNSEPSPLLLAERSLPVRARFSVAREEQEASYGLDAPAIMNILQSSGPMDRSGDFRAMARARK